MSPPPSPGQSVVMDAHTCPSGQPLGTSHIDEKKFVSNLKSGVTFVIFSIPGLFVDLVGVKTISCNMVRLNTSTVWRTRKSSGPRRVRYCSGVSMMTQESMMSLDLSGDLIVSTNPGYMGTKESNPGTLTW